jgi:hypothetical protein
MLISSIERPTMRDIFSGYHTGDRQWTLEHQQFNEPEFRDLFGETLPNDMLARILAVFENCNLIVIRRFSVPMQGHDGLCRDVYFIETPGSDYCEMYSCVYFQRSPFAGAIAEHYENASIGLMTEYEILDLVEPANDRHQRVLIDTWFDIDGWFEILGACNVIPRLDNIVNGYDPERPLDPVVDEVVQFVYRVLEQGWNNVNDNNDNGNNIPNNDDINEVIV